MPIVVVLDGQQIAVDADVFDLLFENSVVAERAPIAAARRTGRIPFRTLVGLAREAEVPYPLFFAPAEVVEAQIRIKTEKLMAGFTEREFSMNSRHQVHVSDIELIVKDLLRKQQYLRKGVSLGRNAVIGCIRRPGASARQNAETLMSVLALGPYDLRDARNKEGALELLINRLEARHVLVARSAQNFMPQRIPRRAVFSGITVKDKKVPYIFLATGDEGEHVEPAGRKVFTLMLLAVLIGRGTFAPVTYDAHKTEEATQPEYDIVGEVLLPARQLSRDEVGTLEGIKSVADTWKVTPSAVAIRARRLGLIARAPFLEHMGVLREEYASRQQPTMRSPLAVNALRRYNGLECSRRMLGLLDAGQVNSTDFCRLMFSNKLRASDIEAFRAAVS